jgi:hypothetical protein
MKNIDNDLTCVQSSENVSQFEPRTSGRNRRPAFKIQDNQPQKRNKAKTLNESEPGKKRKAQKERGRPTKRVQESPILPRKKEPSSQPMPLATILLPVDSGVEIIEANTLSQVIDTVGLTIQQSEARQHLTKAELNAQTKSLKQALEGPKKIEIARLFALPTADFIASIPAAHTVIFEPFDTGPYRDPRPIHPTRLDFDSPYAIFSLLWTESMWEQLATNTNKYAGIQGAVNQGPGNMTNQRLWWPTCTAEIKVFIGILIYMGLHQESGAQDYWGTNILNGPVHTCAKYMSHDRYQQLHRFFHVSDPSDSLNPDLSESQLDELLEGQEEKHWWYKLEPLISHFRANCMAHWVPGSNIAIDEMMIKYYGRSFHTIKMPKKPIKQGYKMWALCEAGYLYNFMFHSRKEGIGELKKHPNLCDTQSMVFQMAKTLPRDKDQIYTIYMDNLFTSINLFRLLREAGFGACGTTRKNASGEEYPALFTILKEKYDKKLPWGTLTAVPVKGVLCLAWVDNNTVLALTTVHTIHEACDLITRWRRAPAPTSTNAAIARKPFKGEARAELEIPRFIDDYNYNMGGVDIADQHRQAFCTQRKTLRNWWCLFYWLLDHSIINAFKIACLEGSWTKRQHKDFRERLWQELFEFAPYVVPQREEQKLGSHRHCVCCLHERVRLYKKPKTCTWCGYESKVRSGLSRTPSPTKRAFGDELPVNYQASPKRPNRTEYGCGRCDVALCKGPCWEQFHTEPAVRPSGF